MYPTCIQVFFNYILNVFKVTDSLKNVEYKHNKFLQSVMKLYLKMKKGYEDIFIHLFCLTAPDNTFELGSDWNHVVLNPNKHD